MGKININGDFKLFIDGEWRAVTGSITHNQEWIEVGDSSEYDPDWVMTDKRGHKHYWINSSYIANAKSIKEKHYEDGDEWTTTHWKCRHCGERIYPAVIIVNHPPVKGLSTVKMDIITHDEFVMNNIIAGEERDLIAMIHGRKLTAKIMPTEITIQELSPGSRVANISVVAHGDITWTTDINI